MINDEAMRLARKVKSHPGALGDFLCDIDRLCDYILSGDHKREIENAAFERARKAVERAIFHVAPDQISSDIVRATDRAISELRKPPAQKAREARR